MGADKQPWEMLSDESDNAFAAFLCYLELGSSRTVRNAEAKYSKARGGKKTAKKQTGGFNSWSQRFRWSQRARAYDDHMAKQTHAAVIASTADRLARFNDGAFGAALLIFNRVVNSIKAYKGEIPPSLWAQLLSVADKLARLALGASTENVSGNVQVTLDVLRSKELSDAIGDPATYAALERIADSVVQAQLN